MHPTETEREGRRERGASHQGEKGQEKVGQTRGKPGSIDRSGKRGMATWSLEGRK